MIFLLYLAQWILVIVMLSVFLLLCFWTYTTARAKVPFVPVPNATLEEIARELDIREGNVVYDLGSGDGRVLFYQAKRAPGARFIGLDNNPFATMLAKIRKWASPKDIQDRVHLETKDFFTHDVSDATHVFMYLYPKVMDELLPKLKKELKPGTKLVSMTFQFTDIRPKKEIDLHRAKYKLARKLYVYEF